MNKQKVLHALRGLEITYEQKQELVNALAEGDDSGKEVIIDIGPIMNGVQDHIVLTDEQIESIKNNTCTFMEINDNNFYYGFVNYIYNGSNEIQVTVVLLEDNIIDLVVNNKTKRLAINMPI